MISKLERMHASFTGHSGDRRTSDLDHAQFRGHVYRFLLMRQWALDKIRYSPLTLQVVQRSSRKINPYVRRSRATRDYNPRVAPK